VPTSLSGAELSAFHRPLADGRGAGLVRPRLVVTDPALAASQSTPMLTASAMNAFGHAMEAVYVPGAGPVTSAAAADAVRLLVRGLEEVQRDVRRPVGQAESESDEARRRLALGALLAGYAIAATGVGLHHVLCQSAVRQSGAPHAMVNAVLAPHVLRYMLRAAPEALEPIAAALSVDGGDPVEHVRRLAAGCGVTRLSELGVAEDGLPEIARLAARRPELSGTPSSPGGAQVLTLLRAAF
jgi:alcohol dehydrogenase class IV